MKLPDFKFENQFWEKGYKVIGVDEVGRGAFAGPVGVGGVIFDPEMSSKTRKTLLNMGINDSKKLTKKRREELSLGIKELALYYFISFVDVEQVNKYGVGKATEMGMREVVKKAKSYEQKAKRKLFALIDGYRVKSMRVPQKNIIGGDCLSLSIAAASIIAKVERDKLMQKLSKKFPFYGFELNKGYGTKYHRDKIVSLGVSEIHRIDFCKNWQSLD